MPRTKYSRCLCVLHNYICCVKNDIHTRTRRFVADYFFATICRGQLKLEGHTRHDVTTTRLTCPPVGSGWNYRHCPAEPCGTIDLTRLPPQTTSSRWQVDKEAIGLSRVQQFSHLCVARPYQISVNSIFKHIHTTSINTII